MSHVRDMSLAGSGRMKIRWVQDFMPALVAIRARFEREKPFAGKKITISIHMEAKTAFLALCLAAGGAEVHATGCNPLSTQDDVAAGLASMGVETYAMHGVNAAEYRGLLVEALSCCPDLIIDDGGDLLDLLSGDYAHLGKNLLGGAEETTTGIHRLHARARAGVPYNRMAVICRDAAQYLGPLRYEFRLQNIPLFCDEATTPENTAPARAVHAALELARGGISSRTVLRLLKTGLVNLPERQQTALENYAYTWSLKAADWRAPFEKNPAGFGAQMTDEDRAALARAEALRAEVVPRVERFLDAAGGQTAAGISKQLYLLLDAFSGAEHTAQAAAAFEQAGDPLRARALYATWENMMDLLGQMEQLLGGDEVTAAEYAELFALLLHCRTKAVSDCRFGYLQAQPPVYESGKLIMGAFVLLAPDTGDPIPVEVMRMVSAQLIEEPEVIERLRTGQRDAAVQLLEEKLDRLFSEHGN